MIKKILLNLLLMQVILLNQMTVNAETGSTSPFLQAQSVVQNYLDALFRGDTRSIRQLLGGVYLKEKEMLLNDPGYSSMLSELYSNATYEINSIESPNKVDVVISVRLITDSNNYIDTRFIVSPVINASTKQSKYLITGEID